MFSMGMLVLLSFAATNLQAVFWQSSSWLVGAVLPAVVIDLTNAERLEGAAGTLIRSVKLDEAARLKAEDMAQKEYFAHDSPGGITPWYWFDKVNYSYAHAGENLAIHFNDSGTVVEAWMNSPSHRANIVNKKYTEIGVGTAEGMYEGQETVFVVQLFGTPAAALQPKVALVLPNTVEPQALAAAVAPQTLAEGTIESEEARAAITLPEVILEREPVTQEVRPPARTEVAEASLPEEVLGALENIALQAEPFEEMTAPDLTALELAVDAALFPSAPSEADISLATLGRESLFMSTSSGLLAAEIFASSAGATVNYSSRFNMMATSPSLTLQTLYLIVGLFVVAVLLSSIVLSMRQARFVQVAYGLALLLVMSALFTVHGALTGSALIASTESSVVVVLGA